MWTTIHQQVSLSQHKQTVVPDTAECEAGREETTFKSSTQLQNSEVSHNDELPLKPLFCRKGMTEAQGHTDVIIYPLFVSIFSPCHIDNSVTFKDWMKTERNYIWDKHCTINTIQCDGMNKMERRLTRKSRTNPSYQRQIINVLWCGMTQQCKGHQKMQVFMRNDSALNNCLRKNKQSSKQTHAILITDYLEDMHFFNQNVHKN